MAYSTGEYSSTGKALSISDIRKGAVPVSTVRKPAAPSAFTSPSKTVGNIIPRTASTAIPTAAPTATTQINTGRPLSPYGVGGGSPGGGGAQPQPTPIMTPTSTPSGTTGLEGASNDALAAEVAALEAQYGLTLAQIAALGGDVGARANFLLAQLAQQEKFAEEDLVSGLLQRGVYRSGMTARDLSRLADLFGEKRAQVEMDRNSQLQQLELQRGAATAGMRAAQGAAFGNLEAGNTQAQLAQMFNSGTVPNGLALPGDASAMGNPVYSQPDRSGLTVSKADLDKIGSTRFGY